MRPSSISLLLLAAACGSDSNGNFCDDGHPCDPGFACAGDYVP